MFDIFVPGNRRSSGNLFCFALLCFFLKELEESKRHKSGQVESICCRDGVIFKPSSKIVHSPIIERTTKHGTSKPSNAHAAAERRSRTLLRPITWLLHDAERYSRLVERVFDDGETT